MRFPIKIVYDVEDRQYVVFVDGIQNLEGYGQTEEEAIADFNRNLEAKLNA